MPVLEDLLREQSQLAEQRRCLSAFLLGKKNISIRIPTDGTDTSDIVAGQDFVVAEANDELCVFVSPAALSFAVAAVELHLDLALAVALHDWPGERNVETRARQKGGKTQRERNGFQN